MTEAEITELNRTQADAAAWVAEECFNGGASCIRAVLEATTGPLSAELKAATAGFSSGIGESGCLCGAVTGGVMALGLKGQGRRSGELVQLFKEQFGTTCCRGLSRNYQWLSDEHLSNCCGITAATAGMVADLLAEE